MVTQGMSDADDGGRAGETPAATFTVATWNVCMGVEFEALLSAGSRESLAEAARKLLDGVSETRFPDRAETIARVVARHRPDVLGLQELGRWETGGDDGEQMLYSFPDIMLEALATAGAPYVMIHCVDTVTGQLPVDGPQWARFTSCDALLLRMDPDVDMSVIEIDDGHYSTYLTAELAGGGRSFPIRRGWVAVDLERNGHRVRAIVTHLDSMDADVRRAQAHELVSLASTSRYPVIMVGDLNSEATGQTDTSGSPSSRDGVIEVLANAGYADAWSCCDDLATAHRTPEVAGGHGVRPAEGVEVMDVRGATWGPADGLRALEGRDMTQRIDYVLFDPDVIGACSSQVIGVDPTDVTSTTPPLLPSDHGCLFVRLEFRPT